MADLTPLSISYPLTKKTKKVQCDEKSYEAKIGRRAFKPDDTPKHDFGSDYRSALPSVVDEASKAKKSPQHAANLLLPMVNRSAKNCDSNAFPAKTGQSIAKERVSVEIPRASDLHHKPRSQGYASQAFSSDTSTPITARPSPSVPPSTEFAKECVADKDGYRPTGREAHPSEQDEEEDTDYYCATESDLESRPDDDDDINYTIDPAVEDDRIDALRSRFKEVRIRKRQRENVQGGTGGGDETDDTARLDGGWAQEGLRAPCSRAEEEETSAHVGKKSRIGKTRA